MPAGFFVGTRFVHRTSRSPRRASIQKGETMLVLATMFLPILAVILAAAGKALLLTWLTGGGLGAFVLFFFLFKMMGK